MAYFVLDQDLDDLENAAIGGVPENIDPTDWILGTWMPPLPTPLSVTVHERSGELRGDIMGGLVSLYSTKLKEALENFGVDSIQYFPVSLRDPESRKTEAGYFLVNIVGRIACLNRDQSHFEVSPTGKVNPG